MNRIGPSIPAQPFQLNLDPPACPQPLGFDGAVPGVPGVAADPFADPLSCVFPNMRVPMDPDRRVALGGGARTAADGLAGKLETLGFTTEDGRPKFNPGATFGSCKVSLKVAGMTLQDPVPDEVKVRVKCKF